MKCLARESGFDDRFAEMQTQQVDFDLVGLVSRIPCEDNSKQFFGVAAATVFFCHNSVPRDSTSVHLDYPVVPAFNANQSHRLRKRCSLFSARIDVPDTPDMSSLLSGLIR